ncbi:hypothetical protein BM221_007245 [Beauveria bassiana]|uniref:Uncharacterized protein n=1 Tax=Beauveria bassiana TaxID=176275 RepID=A0A2N6NJX4_BEABA|nr:hypothetical protein BM221_007245 [Beauveria bassiana]
MVRIRNDRKSRDNAKSNQRKPYIQLTTKSFVQLSPNPIRASRKCEAYENKPETNSLAKDCSPAGRAGWPGHNCHRDKKCKREKQKDYDSDSDSDEKMVADTHVRMAGEATAKMRRANFRRCEQRLCYV